jgi:hypothetical protein
MSLLLLSFCSFVYSRHKKIIAFRPLFHDILQGAGVYSAFSWARLLVLRPRGSLLVQTIYIVSGDLLMLVTLTTCSRSVVRHECYIHSRSRLAGSPWHSPTRAVPPRRIVTVWPGCADSVLRNAILRILTGPGVWRITQIFDLSWTPSTPSADPVWILGFPETPKNPVFTEMCEIRVFAISRISCKPSHPPGGSKTPILGAIPGI